MIIVVRVCTVLGTSGDRANVDAIDSGRRVYSVLTNCTLRLPRSRVGALVGGRCQYVVQDWCIRGAYGPDRATVDANDRGRRE